MTDHRFKKSDLDILENNPISGKYHLLVVGTFNADIDNNEALWFYGRPDNEFWCLLPRMLNDPTLHPVDRDESLKELKSKWTKYCDEKRIVIVDIFKTVNKHLADHSDKNLKSLKEREYIAFDFKKAFVNVKFDGILFTWKGTETKSCLTALKNQYIEHFRSQGSIIMQMLTPSNAYSKTRRFKLAQWKDEYSHLSKLQPTVRRFDLPP